MKHNFDKETIRRGTQCVKWDEAANAGVLPMWVADMDFEVAPCITEALRKRVAHGIFGYTLVPESYYEAVIRWFSRRHGWDIRRDWILYTSGVVPAMSCVIKALCMPGEKVLVQTPVYNCFFSSVHNNGCQAAVGLHVDASVCRQTPEDDAVGTAFAGDVDVFLHTLKLQIGIEEVAAARTDDDMQERASQHLTGNLDLAVRRGGASLRDVGTQFHPVGAAFLCGDAALHAIGAYLETKVFTVEHTLSSLFLTPNLTSRARRRCAPVPPACGSWGMRCLF